MTYREALDMGFTPGDTKWTSGYLSRKIDIDNQPVKTATKGRREGQKYVDLPTYQSTQYHLRQYLIPPEEG